MKGRVTNWAVCCVFNHAMTQAPAPIPWLAPGAAFPPPEQAWPEGSPAPGLLAAGGALDAGSLQRAYASGIFPWFSAGQPILWWSTDPRMLLRTDAFRLHRSLRKRIDQLLRADRLQIRFDSDFRRVMAHCAQAPRGGQSGTWILPEMVDAYCNLHAAGLAHSVETWIDGELVAGLYCVALGHAVFGESMFTRVNDGSKIALAALVAFGLAKGVEQIDCQQVTRHLASLGARPARRADFLQSLRVQTAQPALQWQFEPVYWKQLGLACAAAAAPTEHL